MDPGNSQWYVIKTARFKENYVALQVRETIGADTYIPIAKLPRRYLRKGQTQFEPLFPGYVFANLDVTAHLLPLRRLRAANSLICFDGRPAYVPPQVIDDLRRKERGRGYINLHIPAGPFAANSHVRVVDGPFSGHSGLFVRYADSMERVRILLDSLQSGGVVELPLTAVAAASG